MDLIHVLVLRLGIRRVIIITTEAKDKSGRNMAALLTTPADVANDATALKWHFAESV